MAQSHTYQNFKDELINKVICGFNLSCVGDERAYSYVSSPFENTLADKAIYSAISKFKNFKKYSFLEEVQDERQYCSPGIRLPLVTFSRSKFGRVSRISFGCRQFEFGNK